MDESDAAFAGLRDLEQTLSGVRRRLADLALLAAGQGPPARQDDVEVLPSADQACGRALPGPLVLPAAVDAPPVVVLTEPSEQSVSLR